MSNLKERKGQGLVEYILLVVVIAVFTIAVVQRLGNVTRSGFSDASEQLRTALRGG